MNPQDFANGAPGALHAQAQLQAQQQQQQQQQQQLQLQQQQQQHHHAQAQAQARMPSHAHAPPQVAPAGMAPVHPGRPAATAAVAPQPGVAGGAPLSVQAAPRAMTHSNQILQQQQLQKLASQQQQQQQLQQQQLRLQQHHQQQQQLQQQQLQQQQRPPVPGGGATQVTVAVPTNRNVNTSVPVQIRVPMQGQNPAQAAAGVPTMPQQLAVAQGVPQQGRAPQTAAEREQRLVKARQMFRFFAGAAVKNKWFDAMPQENEQFREIVRQTEVNPETVNWLDSLKRVTSLMNIHAKQEFSTLLREMRARGQNTSAAMRNSDAGAAQQRVGEAPLQGQPPQQTQPQSQLTPDQLAQLQNQARQQQQHWEARQRQEAERLAAAQRAAAHAAAVSAAAAQPKQPAKKREKKGKKKAKKRKADRQDSEAAPEPKVPRPTPKLANDVAFSRRKLSDAAALADPDQGDTVASNFVETERRLLVPNLVSSGENLPQVRLSLERRMQESIQYWMRTGNSYGVLRPRSMKVHPQSIDFLGRALLERLRDVLESLGRHALHRRRRPEMQCVSGTQRVIVDNQIAGPGVVAPFHELAPPGPGRLSANSTDAAWQWFERRRVQKIKARLLRGGMRPPPTDAEVESACALQDRASGVSAVSHESAPRSSVLSEDFELLEQAKAGRISAQDAELIGQLEAEGRSADARREAHRNGKIQVTLKDVEAAVYSEDISPQVYDKWMSKKRLTRR